MYNIDYGSFKVSQPWSTHKDVKCSTHVKKKMIAERVQFQTQFSLAFFKLYVVVDM